MTETNNFVGVREAIDSIAEKLNLQPNQYRVGYEKNQFMFETHPPRVNKETLIDVMNVCKKHFDNWRIHTLEDNFLSLQALNDNLFDTTDILKNLKIRLSGLYKENTLEITKAGFPTQSEISLISSLLDYFFQNPASTDPLAALEAQGCFVFDDRTEKLTFGQFAGYEPIKKEIQQSVILPFQHSDIYDAISQKTQASPKSNRPRSVLFTGPPGVGKTTMARILAAEAGLILVSIPLENILSSYYGESAKRLGHIFDLAAFASVKPDGKSRPIAIFLDEIDALAPSRNDKIFEATRRMLSTLLRKIEGLERSGAYLTIGATNRIEDIDAALISRFDTIIHFPLPKSTEIEAMLHLYAKHLSPQSAKALASQMEGLSPRTIEDLCKRAERIRARKIIQGEAEKGTLPSEEDYAEAIALSRLI